MLLFILAFLGGVLTIASPCVLPVLPFVFARADQPFVRSGLPTLVGMAITFAAIATLAAVGGGWAVQANQYGRIVALVLLALFGAALLLPDLTTRITSPLVALGSRLSQASGSGGAAKNSIVPSLVLGVAIGLLWAPCAGPILGLILTGAALKGASAQTSLLLLSYAAGAATSLALALLVGGRVFAAMKRSLGVGEWIRRGLGVAVLLAVVVIAMGMDTGVLTRISLASTTTLEQGLLDRFNMKATAAQTGGLSVEGTMPPLSGAVAWLNSPPLTTPSLKGKVVLVDFWTYSCINCLRTIPYIEAWAQKYRDRGLVVIGVHSPEFAFEKNVDNVRKAVADLHITYPVAIDNDYAIWRAFDNQYWPADYFVDATGRIRDHQFGEGDYDKSERVIQQLLVEAGAKNLPTGLVNVRGAGAEAPPDANDVESQETYVGYERAENFASPAGAVRDAPHTYSLPALALNDWALSGNWTVGRENAVLNTSGGAIAYRFHARDLHLVMGPGANDKPVRFQILLDGKAPGTNHGADTDSNGFGTVSAQRLYQLVRQSGNVTDKTLEIRFLDPGVQAFSFTFG
jgi:cytochrome c biogenesis protein CcdA/thiol-disulfide isomerase/thioredoxin